MNVAFFLMPKSQVVWLPTRSTLAQAIRRMEDSGYTALPLLDDDELYAGTITEGDVLRKLLQTGGLDSSGAERVPLTQVRVKTKVCHVGIDAHIEELFGCAIEQNFVPVTDSRNAFVGIVRRREILEFCARVFHGSTPRVT